MLNHIIFLFSPGAREKKVEYTTYYSSADTYNTTYRLLLFVKPSRPSVTCVLACSWARGLVDLPCWQRGIMVVHFLGPFVRLRHGLFSNQQKTGTRLSRAERAAKATTHKKGSRQAIILMSSLLLGQSFFFLIARSRFPALAFFQ